jgi:hypothetical protein
VIGVVVVAWGSAMFIGAYRTYTSALFAEPAAKSTRQFLMLVGSGNLTSAQAMTTDAITLDQLTSTNEQIEAWGGLKGDIGDKLGWSVEDMEKINISLEVAFVKTTRVLWCDWVMVDGSPRLTRYEFKDPPTTGSSD